ncbi:MORN repeat protein (macronuclear) [Tetrahymena thermophila SB210]|uniref:MORN repeat protein n=1 Tax=Tetrahymena thermophila (strain SB210) TaxID=312017 RepID=Q233J8_TETTS|nr:MORN repeat protein [Tetrahymena thermophila SB210]EAR91582.1 MORN repeat protein [Tetrahymena thermophila SB210]|eukprot:XP_001011827.1 MORN repeat protein [Tetrahymena thermophila SB210]
MGLQQSKGIINPTHKVQDDDINLRRQRSLFFPLGENRRIKTIDYLLVACDTLESGGVEKDQSSVLNKDLQEKRKKLKATSSANLQLIEEAFKEYDYNYSKSNVVKINFQLQKKSFDDYLNDLFSNSNTNGFILYFTGQLTEAQQLVINQTENTAVFYDFKNIIKRWRRVPNYTNKHLLIIVDAENSGSILALNKKVHLEEYEDIFGLDQTNESEFKYRRDPTFSIFASQTQRSKDKEFYLGESPNNNFQGDFKNNTRLQNNGKGPNSFNDASVNHVEIDNEKMQSYIQASGFTALFSQYLKSGKPSSITDIAKAKDIQTVLNDNDPFFFGFMVKAYLDFGIFFWARYQKMINQLELNCYVAVGLTIKNSSQANSNNEKIGQFTSQIYQAITDDQKLMLAKDLTETQKVQGLMSSPQKSKVSTLAELDSNNYSDLESKLLHNSVKGQYFGFVGILKKDKKFGNPLFSKPAQAPKTSNQLNLIKSIDNLDVPESNNNLISSLNHLEVSSFQSNNAFKSTILRGNQNLDEGNIVRKHYGMQEYYKEIEGQQNKSEAQFSELYEGMWNEDKFSNYGTYYYSNGDRYEGEYKKGMKSGFGIYYYSNGNIYAGNFEENQMDGVGKFIFTDGEIFIGNFKKNKKEGFGIKKQSYEQVDMILSGKWINDNQNGQFKITLSSLKDVTMNAFFKKGEISENAKYTVKISQDKEVSFNAKWINNRRVQGFQIQEDLKKQESEYSQYLNKIEQFDKEYIKFIPPTIKVESDVKNANKNA